jgi:hypothetical protein
VTTPLIRRANYSKSTNFQISCDEKGKAFVILFELLFLNKLRLEKYFFLTIVKIFAQKN